MPRSISADGLNPFVPRRNQTLYGAFRQGMRRKPDVTYCATILLGTVNSAFTMIRPIRQIVPILLLAVCSFAQQAIRVPTGKPVMLDATIGDDWQDAKNIELADLATLYVKQSDEYVWLALKLKSDDGAVDFYFSPADGSLYDLHSSAKLGERKFHDRAWPDWKWWNNEGWVANVSRVDSFEKRTFLPTKVREYQIRRSRFPGSEWKVMFEFLTPAEPEWKVTPYPRSSSNTDSKDWLILRFGDTK